MFKSVKMVYAIDEILYYPDFNKFYDIHTDSSEYQMGEIISQNERMVAYWSPKLTDTQNKYPSTDKELFLILECLKKCKKILLGQKIFARIDHRNITNKLFEYATQRVLRQRLPLEEYRVTLRFIQGTKK